MKLEGFQYAMSLDLNMGYYHIQLRKNARNLCTIILPWEKYCYKRLPMGGANYPDIFRQKMNGLFHVFGFIRAYIYHLLILTKVDCTDHVQKLEIILNKLKEKVLKCNMETYFFGKTKMEYLGFWVTRDGVKPINKNIAAITNMKPTTSRQEVRKFIGL